jgi:hypothetical protein
VGENPASRQAYLSNKSYQLCFHFSIVVIIANYYSKMPTAPPASSQGPSRAKLRWESVMEDALIDTLMEAQTQGLNTDNASFKPAGWQMALEAVKRCTNQPIEVKQIKSKWDTFKADWKAWKAFIGHTGFGWDAEKGVPTTEPEVLEAYFQSNPRTRKFRDRPIPYADQLQIILEGAVTTGEDTRSITGAILASQVALEQRLNNDNSDVDSETEETYEWPESPLHAAVATPSVPLLATTQIQTDDNSAILADLTAARLPSVSLDRATPTTDPSPASNRSNTESSLRQRKRSQKNAAEADSRKRKKTSGYALADAIHATADVLKDSNKLMADQLVQQGDISSRIASVIVTEFNDLLVEEQAFVNSVLENKGKASLFLAWTLEQRKIWVDQVLSQRH